MNTEDQKAKEARTTIHKYVTSLHEINPANRLRLQIPAGARIISMRGIGHGIEVWAEVAPENRKEGRALHVIGTGHPLPPERGDFIATLFFDQGLVFHFYDEAS